MAAFKSSLLASLDRQNIEYNILIKKYDIMGLFQSVYNDESEDAILGSAVELCFQKAEKHHFRSSIKLILLICTHKVTQLSLWN